MQRLEVSLENPVVCRQKQACGLETHSQPPPLPTPLSSMVELTRCNSTRMNPPPPPHRGTFQVKLKEVAAYLF